MSTQEVDICLRGGTEAPFTGAFWDMHDEGEYLCKGCDARLFRSTEKFESGSGWPSFWDVVNEEAISKVVDRSHGMERTEVKCRNCSCHLGHVFTDGPADKTGLRYCINSASLKFAAKQVA